MQTEHHFPGHQVALTHLKQRPDRRQGVHPAALLAVAMLGMGLSACQPLSPHLPAAASHAGLSTDPAPADPLRSPHYANFAGSTASNDVRFIANWVLDSGDNRQMSFVIIDKKNTRVFVFNPAGKLLGSTLALLGAAKGDDSAPGIGTRPLADVRAEEKTTPAGRFVAEPGRNASGEDIVWVDYDAAVSMHRVRTANPKERRLERLASSTSADNRISFGCINMPAAFYENVLSPQFNARYGVVYVLPDVKRTSEVFADAYDPAARLRAAISVRRADASAKTRTRL